MEVKPIRDEIAKIDAMLQSIDAELETLREEPEEMEIVESEYMGILGALSNAPISNNSPTCAAPFSALMMELDSPHQSTSPIILDAFTFFGLIQAFSEDESVMKCLCQIFPSVYGVTTTQLEDSLLLIDRIRSKTIRSEFVESLLGRVVVELNESDSRKKSALLTIIAKCCDMTAITKSTILSDLFNHVEFSEWPIGVKIQIGFSAREKISKSDLAKFIDSIIPSLETSVETKWLSQLVEMAIIADNVKGVEKLVSSTTIQKSTCGPSDVHKLVISLGKLSTLTEVPVSVWQTAVEKLTGSAGMLPVYEIEGTLAALSAARVSSDLFFQNTNTFKKKINEISKCQFFEIVNFLVQTGDKSPLSIVTKTIMERRDMFVSDNMDQLISVLLLSVVTSLESGSVIPESILLLKKFSPQIISYMELNREKSEIIACLFAVLLPSTTSINFPQVDRLPAIPAQARVESVLDLLGHRLDNEILLSNYSVDSLVADYAIPSEKLAIVIERFSVFNCSLNRATLCGPTALKVNVLATRKNFKVVVVIPELYSDDKSLIQLLGDPLRRLPLTCMNTELVVTDSPIDSVISSLQHSQRIGRVVFGKDLGVVDIAKFLFAVLRTPVCVGHFDFSSTTCGISDQFITLLLTEFISSYVIRQRLAGTVFNFRNCPTVTASGIGRLIESANGNTPLRIMSDLDEAGVSRLTDLLASNGYTVVTPPAAIPTSSNHIYLG